MPTLKASCKAFRTEMSIGKSMFDKEALDGMIERLVQF